MKLMETMSDNCKANCNEMVKMKWWHLQAWWYDIHFKEVTWISRVNEGREEMS